MGGGGIKIEGQRALAAYFTGQPPSLLLGIIKRRTKLESLLSNCFAFWFWSLKSLKTERGEKRLREAQKEERCWSEFEADEVYK